jgi:glycosyltransferase involved in cell wall biosynthesis
MSRSKVNQIMGVEDDDYIFLSVATWQKRKNLPELIEAFVREFGDEPKVKLVVKTAFGFTSLEDAVAETAAAIRRANPSPKFKAEDRIKLFAHFWPDEAIEALMQRADCYVSLHSGEGWCYPLFDAACNGTPVIATGYSGPLDYLDPQHHHLVRYEMEPVDTTGQPDFFVFTPDMRWAKPDIAHAAALMRKVYENPNLARENAGAAAVQLKQKYSMEAVGQMAHNRLAALADRLAVHV